MIQSWNGVFVRVALIALFLPAQVVAQPTISSQTVADTCGVVITPRTGTTPIARDITWSYNEQARASIAALYPQNRILAERRVGDFGKIEYSMMVYQKTASDSVRLDVLAVNRELHKVWYLTTMCTLVNWPAGMITLLEATAALR